MKKFSEIFLKCYLSIKHNERGATAVEYGLMVALIAVVIITAVGLLGTQINALFAFIVNALT